MDSKMCLNLKPFSAGTADCASRCFDARCASFSSENDNVSANAPNLSARPPDVPTRKLAAGGGGEGTLRRYFPLCFGQGPSPFTHPQTSGFVLVPPPASHQACFEIGAVPPSVESNAHSDPIPSIDKNPAAATTQNLNLQVPPLLPPHQNEGASSRAPEYILDGASGRSSQSSATKYRIHCQLVGTCRGCHHFFVTAEPAAGTHPDPSAASPDNTSTYEATRLHLSSTRREQRAMTDEKTASSDGHLEQSGIYLRRQLENGAETLSTASTPNKQPVDFACDCAKRLSEVDLAPTVLREAHQNYEQLAEEQRVSHKHLSMQGHVHSFTSRSQTNGKVAKQQETEVDATSGSGSATRQMPSLSCFALCESLQQISSAAAAVAALLAVETNLNSSPKTVGRSLPVDTFTADGSCGTASAHSDVVPVLDTSSNRTPPHPLSNKCAVQEALQAVILSGNGTTGSAVDFKACASGSSIAPASGMVAAEPTKYRLLRARRPPPLDPVLLEQSAEFPQALFTLSSCTPSPPCYFNRCGCLISPPAAECRTYQSIDGHHLSVRLSEGETQVIQQQQDLNRCSALQNIPQSTLRDHDLVPSGGSTKLNAGSSQCSAEVEARSVVPNLRRTPVQDISSLTHFGTTEHGHHQGGWKRACCSGRNHQVSCNEHEKQQKKRKAQEMTARLQHPSQTICLSTKPTVMTRIGSVDLESSGTCSKKHKRSASNGSRQRAKVRFLVADNPDVSKDKHRRGVTPTVLSQTEPCTRGSEHPQALGETRTLQESNISRQFTFPAETKTVCSPATSYVPDLLAPVRDRQEDCGTCGNVTRHEEGHNEGLQVHSDLLAMMPACKTNQDYSWTALGVLPLQGPCRRSSKPRQDSREEEEYQRRPNCWLSGSRLPAAKPGSIISPSVSFNEVGPACGTPSKDEHEDFSEETIRNTTREHRPNENDYSGTGQTPFLETWATLDILCMGTPEVDSLSFCCGAEDAMQDRDGNGKEQPQVGECSAQRLNSFALIPASRAAPQMAPPSQIRDPFECCREASTYGLATDARWPALDELSHNLPKMPISGKSVQESLKFTATPSFPEVNCRAPLENLHETDNEQDTVRVSLLPATTVTASAASPAEAACERYSGTSRGVHTHTTLNDAVGDASEKPYSTVTESRPCFQDIEPTSFSTKYILSRLLGRRCPEKQFSTQEKQTPEGGPVGSDRVAGAATDIPGASVATQSIHQNVLSQPTRITSAQPVASALQCIEADPLQDTSVSECMPQASVVVFCGTNAFPEFSLDASQEMPWSHDQVDIPQDMRNLPSEYAISTLPQPHAMAVRGRSRRVRQILWAEQCAQMQSPQEMKPDEGSPQAAAEHTTVAALQCLTRTHPEESGRPLPVNASDERAVLSSLCGDSSSFRTPIQDAAVELSCTSMIPLTGTERSGRKRKLEEGNAVEDARKAPEGSLGKPARPSSGYLKCYRSEDPGDSMYIGVYQTGADAPNVVDAPKGAALPQEEIVALLGRSDKAVFESEGLIEANSEVIRFASQAATSLPGPTGVTPDARVTRTLPENRGTPIQMNMPQEATGVSGLSAVPESSPVCPHVAATQPGCSGSTRLPINAKVSEEQAAIERALRALGATPDDLLVVLLGCLLVAENRGPQNSVPQKLSDTDSVQTASLAPTAYIQAHHDVMPLREGLTAEPLIGTASFIQTHELQTGAAAECVPRAADDAAEDRVEALFHCQPEQVRQPASQGRINASGGSKTVIVPWAEVVAQAHKYEVELRLEDIERAAVDTVEELIKALLQCHPEQVGQSLQAVSSQRTIKASRGSQDSIRRGTEDVVRTEGLQAGIVLDSMPRAALEAAKELIDALPRHCRLYYAEQERQSLQGVSQGTVDASGSSQGSLMLRIDKVETNELQDRDALEGIPLAVLEAGNKLLAALVQCHPERKRQPLQVALSEGTRNAPERSQWTTTLAQREHEEASRGSSTNPTGKSVNPNPPEQAESVDSAQLDATAGPDQLMAAAPDYPSQAQGGASEGLKQLLALWEEATREALPRHTPAPDGRPIPRLPETEELSRITAPQQRNRNNGRSPPPHLLHSFWAISPPGCPVRSHAIRRRAATSRAQLQRTLREKHACTSIPGAVACDISASSTEVTQPRFLVAPPGCYVCTRRKGAVLDYNGVPIKASTRARPLL